MPPSDPTFSGIPKPCILVVDDDEGMRKLLQVALTRHGFRVRITGDGREAIEVYKNHQSDIEAVVLDVRMPGQDGLQTLADLQQLNPHVRAVYVTGFPGDHGDEDLLRQGALRVFQKPFRLLDLVEYLKDILKKD